ncbi:hypothetical protein HKD37_01G001216 [Glycine soja]
MKKRHTGHQSVSLKNKTGDSTVLKIGDSAKVVIKQDMKGGEHKYGFNNNKHEKPEKVRVVDDETDDKHELFEVLRMPSRCVFFKVFMSFLHHSTFSCHSFPDSLKDYSE